MFNITKIQLLITVQVGPEVRKNLIRLRKSLARRQNVNLATLLAKLLVPTIIVNMITKEIKRVTKVEILNFKKPSANKVATEKIIKELKGNKSE